MYLYFQQIEDLLKIIDCNQCIVSGGFGSDFVTQEDKNMLLKYGVDFNKLLIKNGKTVFNQFNFAMLAESIKELEKTNCTYVALEAFVKRGKYIPQSTRDKFMIECIRNQTFSEIQNHPHFHVIKDQFIEGVEERRILTKIISDIGHKTKDWGLYNILMHYHKIAWEKATAMEIRKRNEGKDVLVYKNVHSGCCEECIKLFLTNGVKKSS